MSSARKAFAWEAKLIKNEIRSKRNQKKTPSNRFKLHNPFGPERFDPAQTNHTRLLARREWLKQRQAVLRKLVVETKAKYPDERMSYTAWKKLAVQEAQPQTQVQA